MTCFEMIWVLKRKMADIYRSLVCEGNLKGLGAHDYIS